jgi:hypothetical protein
MIGSAGCYYLWRWEGFFCSLEVLYGGIFFSQKLHQCCGLGSGDFLTPVSGSEIRNEYFCIPDLGFRFPDPTYELGPNIFRLKLFKFFVVLLISFSIL